MIFKLLTMGGQEIVLENEEAVQDLLKQANSGKKLVLTKYGVVNIASIDSIVLHTEFQTALNYQISIGKSMDEAKREVFGSSPFAKILAPKMTMLNPQSRTTIQEESAKQERQLKT